MVNVSRRRMLSGADFVLVTKPPMGFIVDLDVFSRERKMVKRFGWYLPDRYLYVCGRGCRRAKAVKTASQHRQMQLRCNAGPSRANSRSRNRASDSDCDAVRIKQTSRIQLCSLTLCSSTLGIYSCVGLKAARLFQLSSLWARALLALPNSPPSRSQSLTADSIQRARAIAYAFPSVPQGSRGILIKSDHDELQFRPRQRRRWRPAKRGEVPGLECSSLIAVHPLAREESIC